MMGRKRGVATALIMARKLATTGLGVSWWNLEAQFIGRSRRKRCQDSNYVKVVIISWCPEAVKFARQTLWRAR